MGKRLLSAAIAFVMVLSLCGCTDNKQKEYREKAEGYAKELEAVSAGDTITLTENAFDKVGQFYPFEAYSEKYGDTFVIYAAEDGSFCDTYVSLYLLEDAGEECGRVIDEALSGKSVSYDVSLNRNFIAGSVSGGKVESIYEACSLSGTIIRLSVKGDGALSEKEMGDVLKAMQENGLFCEMTVEGDARSFEADDEGIWYLAGGADGGKYIERHVYEPTE